MENPPRRFVSLGTRLAIGTVAIVAVACVAMFLQLSEWQRSRAVSAKAVAARMVTTLFATSVAAQVDFGDIEGVDAQLAYLRKNAAFVRGSVWLPGERTAMATTVVGTFEDPPPAVSAALVTPRAGEVEVVAPITSVSGAKLGTARVVLSLADEDAALAAERLRLMPIIALLGLFVGASLLYFVRRNVVTPLEKLATAAAKIEAGTIADARLDVVSNDELGRLAAAWNAMRAAIADRESRLEEAHARTRELLDHLRQAIVVIGPDGVAGAEQSRIAARVFGVDRVEGKRATELLYPNRDAIDVEVAALETWLGLAFEADAEDCDAVAALAPREARLFAGTATEKILELELRPIASDGRVSRIMVLAADVTAARHLEGRVKHQEERHAQEMGAMKRLLRGGGSAFVDFLDRARRSLDACDRAAASGALAGGELAAFFQRIHTLRGEAAAFESVALAAALTSLEGCLTEHRDADEARRAIAAPVLQKGLVAAREALDHNVQMFVAAAPTGRLALDQTVVRRSDLARLEALIGAAQGDLAEVSRRLISRPFGEMCDALVEQASRWAASERKLVHVDVVGREQLVDVRLARVLPGVLAHLVRNAIAHGIEPSDARATVGKTPTGEIVITCTGEGDDLVVAIADDGAGVDGAKMLAQAKSRGIDVAGVAASDVDRILDLGVSSRDEANDLAGHGVGLGALRADLAVVGYRARVQTTSGRGTTFVIEPARGKIG